MAECVPYKRHLPPCRETSRAYTRCDCPCYAQGDVVRANGIIEYVNRKSLHTTDMALARKIVRTWHNNHTAQPVTKQNALTLETAVDLFLAARERQKKPSTDAVNDQYALILKRRLVPYCTSRACNANLLTDVTNDMLEQFVAGWPHSALTSSLQLGRVRKFFKWCEVRGHITSVNNPARAIESISRVHTQKQPYTPAQMQQILAACDRFPTNTTANPVMMKAFVLVQRWCGTRISDTIALRWTDLADGCIDYTAQKNGKRVTIPINPDAMEALSRIERDDSDFVFHRNRRSPLTNKGKTRPSVKTRWTECFVELFKLAKITDGGSHRLRHTCAVEALAIGIPSEEVAQVLGDDVITIIHSYSALTKARRERTAALVRSQWAATA